MKTQQTYPPDLSKYTMNKNEWKENMQSKIFAVKQTETLPRWSGQKPKTALQTSEKCVYW